MTKTKKSTYQRFVLIAVVSVLLIAEGFCGYRLHILSDKQETIKEDYSAVNNITFGILSVNKWRDLIVSSVSHRIQNFDLTESQEDSLRKQINQMLYSLVDNIDSLVGTPGQSLGGKIKNWAIGAFVNKDDLKKKVPGLSDDIMNEIQNPSTKQRLKSIAKEKLEDLGNETYDSSRRMERTVIDSIFNKYNVSEASGFEKKTNSLLSQLRHKTYLYAFGMLGIIILLLVSWWLLRKMNYLHATLYILSIISALILLMVGLTTTMIEIDARIKSLDFHLIGETISFDNQVLYFQSKSIIDVVMILIRTGKYDSILVGILILCFSILFPVTKLLSTGIYLMSKKKWAKHKVIRYFAFKSGKWSMADVMVVAIFMAYVGFNGILNDELSSLDVQNETITSISTNHTSLQPGYIIFVGFVLYGLALSEILNKISSAPTQSC